MKKHIALHAGIMIIVFIIITGCGLDDFSNIGAPVWTIEATIPFSERVYRMSELVTDSAKFADRGWGLFVNEEDTVMRFEYKKDLEYQTIGDRLTYNASSDTGRYTNEIGLIHIDDPDLLSNSVMINQISDSIQIGFEYPELPDFQFDRVERELEFDVFHWVQIDSGMMNVTIQNNYPFAIDRMEISFYNNDVENSDFIGTVIFDEPIAINASGTRQLNLAGKRVYNNLLLKADGSTSGSDTPITFTGNENMEIRTKIGEMNVESARAQIGEQEPFDMSNALDIDNENLIREAVIKSGEVYYRLRNTLPLHVFVELEFPNIKGEDETPYTTTIELPPQAATEILAIPLAGKTIQMDLNNQKLEVETISEVESTGENYVIISEDQGIYVEYWSGDMMLAYLEGRLKNERFEVPEEVTEVKIPSGLGGIDFVGVDIYVNIHNEINVPLHLDLNIESVNTEDDTTVSMTIDRRIFPGDTTIVISGVDGLIEIIPDRIIASGWIELGVDYFPEYEHPDSLMILSEFQGYSGEMTLTSDLKFVVGQTSLTTEPDSLEQSLTDSIYFHLLSASIRLVMNNGIPLAGSVMILMGNDTTDMKTIFQVELPEVQVENHRAKEVVEDISLLELGPDELDIMRKQPLYTQQIINIGGTETDTIYIHADDSLAVQISATIYSAINPNKGD